MWIRPSLLLLAFAIAACGAPPPREDTKRHDAFVQAVNDAAPCGELDFRVILGDDWDRAVFLGPYATNDGAKEALGFAFDVEKLSPWSSTEGGDVVVLVKDQAHIAWFAIASAESGLQVGDYASIDASNLDFTVVVDPTGARVLVPTDTAAC